MGDPNKEYHDLHTFLELPGIEFRMHAFQLQLR